MKLKVDNVSYLAVIRSAGKILKLVRAIAAKDLEAITVLAFEIAVVFTNVEEIMDAEAIGELAVEIEAAVLDFTGNNESPAIMPVG